MSIVLAQQLIGKVSNEYPSVFLLGFDTFSCQVPIWDSTLSWYKKATVKKKYLAGLLANI